MDDVEDNSDLRRGIPVAHKIYGIPQTINTANYVYFQVFSLIFSLGPPGAGASGSSTPTSASAAAAAASAAGAAAGSSSEASEASSVERLVVDELIALHRGQGMDLFWRDNLVCPTEAEYVEMVNNKTGGLLRIALKLMLAHSPLYAASASAGASSAGEERQGGAGRGGAPDLIPLVNLIGLLFQIRDDYMNLQSADYAHNKGFAEDLTEGKFSFPIIHSIRSSEPVPLGSNASLSSGSSAASAGANTLLASSAHSAHAPAATSSGGNRQLLSILRQRPADAATKQYAVAYMRTQTRSFAYTRDVMTRLDVLVRQEIESCETAFAQLDGEDGKLEGQEGRGRNEALDAIVKALRQGWWGVEEEE